MRETEPNSTQPEHKAVFTPSSASSGSTGLLSGRIPLLAVMRSQGAGHLSTSISTDQGYHWSAPVQITEDREHPGDLLRLSSGQILLTFGQRNKPYGVQAMVSSDEGRTWNRRERVMLAWDADHGDIGYPVPIERSDGRLLTVYYVVCGERDFGGRQGYRAEECFHASSDLGSARKLDAIPPVINNAVTDLSDWLSGTKVRWRCLRLESGERPPGGGLFYKGDTT